MKTTFSTHRSTFVYARPYKHTHTHVHKHAHSRHTVVCLLLRIVWTLGRVFACCCTILRPRRHPFEMSVDVSECEFACFSTIMMMMGNGAANAEGTNKVQKEFGGTQRSVDCEQEYKGRTCLSRAAQLTCTHALLGHVLNSWDLLCGLFMCLLFTYCVPSIVTMTSTLQVGL